MIRLPRIRKRFQKEVDKYNKFFGETEKIKRFDLVESEWTFDSGEITPTLKLKRNFIVKKYDSQIQKLFA